MTASEGQFKPSQDKPQAIALWEAGDPPVSIDPNLERIPVLGMVYRSLKDWQAECAPRKYPQSVVERVQLGSLGENTVQDYRNQYPGQVGNPVER